MRNFSNARALFMGFVVFSLLTGCAATPVVHLDQVSGGKLMKGRGVSFNLPPGKSWNVVRNFEDHIALGQASDDRVETSVIEMKISQSQEEVPDQVFINGIKKLLATKTDESRFNILNKEVYVDSGRSEICVLYENTTEDYGVPNKGGEKYLLLRIYGIHCKHPLRKKEVVSLSFSKRLRPGNPDQDIKREGESVFKSMRFF